MTTVCLTMIVRDEGSVIRRCLERVWPLIDAWCVVDTGSTDGTQDTIRGTVMALPHKPGQLVERPWVDFGHNRSDVLEMARPMADYSLMLDADDTLRPPDGFAWPDLTDDSYTLRYKLGNVVWRRATLFSNRLPWRYRGVLHEAPYCPASGSQGQIDLDIVCGNDGARRRDPDKYAKDAVVLAKALETEMDPALRSRYQFYLAQSHRDAGDLANAELHYARRANMGGWTEEIYISLLELAKIAEKFGSSDAFVAYQRAAAVAPDRAEADYKMALLYRMRGDFESGYWTARNAMFKPVPENGLFCDRWVHQYGLLDEFAVSAYHSGRYQDCITACEILLTEGHGPDKARYLDNLIWAKKKLLGL